MLASLCELSTLAVAGAHGGSIWLLLFFGALKDWRAKSVKGWQALLKGSDFRGIAIEFNPAVKLLIKNLFLIIR